MGWSNIRSTLILIALWAFLPAQLSAQILSANSDNTANFCRASFTFPAEEYGNVDMPTTYRGNCPTGYAEGFLTLTVTPETKENLTTVNISSTFVDGKASGRTSYSQQNGITFNGEIDLDGVIRGRFEFYDHQTEGEYRNGRMYTGRVFRAVSMGGGINYFVRGEPVSQEDYNREFGEADPLVAPLAQIPSHTPQMVKLQLEGRKTCLADLPAKLFKIEGDFGGACKNGYYTGKADLKLTPLAGNTLPKMNVSLTYEAGQVVGPVKVKYPTYNTTYVGTLSDWEPQDGATSQPVGNDNYAVIQFQGGQQINQFREYRQPSEETLMLRRLGRELLFIGVNIAVSCVSGDCPFKREKRPPVYQPTQQSLPPVIASNQPSTQGSQPEVIAQVEPTASPTSDAPIETGEPATAQPPVVVAQVDINQSPPAIVEPVPVFGGNTNESAPAFGGVTNQPEPTPAVPAPVITTRPPELPAPQPAPPPIPVPVRVADLPAPISYEPSGVPPPLAPAIPLPEPSNPPPLTPPVQLGGPSGTLGTGPAPSNPDTIQPVAEPPRNPSPPTQPTVRSASVPNVPTGLFPTNERDELGLAFTIGWSGSSDTDYYVLTLHDLTEDSFPENDVRVSGTRYNLRNLKPGHSFAWDVKACNENGCSVRSGNRRFRTVGAVKSDTCRIEVHFKPVPILRLPNHAFIVTTDSNSVTYFRGGPEYNNPINFGRIVTESGSYSPGTPDWTTSPTGSQIVDTLSNNCDNIDRIIGRHITDIGRAGFIYDPLVKNSNSVIRETLERSGYSSVRPVVDATAWYSQLP
jgi:hypothetical protein